jgi:NADH dehydrogenase
LARSSRIAPGGRLFYSQPINDATHWGRNMQGLVTVFGGSGFVGVHVVRALARQGLRVRVAVRDPGSAYRMRMQGDVGQIEVVQANIRDPESVARALRGAQACVNLVGLLYETGRQTFEAVHVQGARNLAQAAVAEGVQRFVQMSAIGANLDSPSNYARTKAMGEAAVREIIPGAVILRPSIVFGPGDRFFNLFGMLAAILPILPVIGDQTNPDAGWGSLKPAPVSPSTGDGTSRFQPVFVGDVAAAAAKAVTDPDAAGRTYELGGPAVYSFKELMRLICRETGRKPVLASVSYSLASLIGWDFDLWSWLVPPLLTRDQVRLLRTDNVVSPGARGLAELGVQAAALEAILPTYLARHRPGGQYADAMVRGA